MRGRARITNPGLPVLTPAGGFDDVAFSGEVTLETAPVSVSSRPALH